MRDLTHLSSGYMFTYVYVWHDSFIYIISHSHTYSRICIYTYLHVWHDSFVYVTHSHTHAHIYVCTYLYAWHDSFMDVTWHSFTYTFIRMTCRICMCAITHPDTHMGWLWSVESSKIQVFFAECSLFYWALLQKRPMLVGSLLIVATSYLIHTCDMPHLSVWCTHIKNKK